MQSIHEAFQASIDNLLAFASRKGVCDDICMDCDEIIAAIKSPDQYELSERLQYDPDTSSIMQFAKISADNFEMALMMLQDVSSLAYQTALATSDEEESDIDDIFEGVSVLDPNVQYPA